MDKYEYQAKLEEINKLIEKENYDAAVKIADTIEWKRVRSVRTLCTISELYEAVGRAEDSKTILYRAYRRSPNSRQILYRLTEACIQTQDFDDAVEYYTEYVNLSPNDNSKYILKYEIYKGRGSSLEEQISVLEELKSREYSEQWAYELARLYDEAGMTDKCVAECDDLALWFHNGKYVVQALELKKKYRPLTPEQQTVYDNPSEIVDMETKEEVVEKAVPTLGEVITKELPRSEKDVIADNIIMDTEKEIAAAVQAPAVEEEPAQEETLQAAGPAKEPEVQTPAQESAPKKNVSTVDLQSELAASMREILSGIRTVPVEQELESAPVILQAPARNTAYEEEQIPGQINIDDLLTGIKEPAPAQRPAPEVQPAAPAQEAAAVQADPLTAPTIDIAKKIQKETGGSVRDYMASLGRRSDAPGNPQPAVQAEAPANPEPTMQAAQASANPQPAVQAEAFTKPNETTQAEAPANPQPTVQTAEAPAEAADVQPEEAREETPVIDPEQYTHESLDEKEKSMLGFWSQIRGMNDQVNEAVTQIMKGVLTDKTSSIGNVALVGDPGNGRTTLAVSLAKIISRCKGQTNVKVAKIYAEDFNKKDIAATVNKMAGGFLIIEEAGDLDDNAVAQLSMAMDFKTDSLVVVLEDERRYLQDLLARNQHFSRKFNVAVNVPMLTNDELVEFGKYYAAEKDCVMDPSAVDALYDNIGVMQSPDQPVAILDVKEIIDKAIKNVNRFGVGKLTSSISGKRYDDQDRVILKAKHFKKVK